MIGFQVCNVSIASFHQNLLPTINPMSQFASQHQSAFKRRTFLCFYNQFFSFQFTVVLLSLMYFISQPLNIIFKSFPSPCYLLPVNFMWYIFYLIAVLMFIVFIVFGQSLCFFISPKQESSFYVGLSLLCGMILSRALHVAANCMIISFR